MKHQTNYLHDVHHLTPQQLEDRYSIEIDEDGVVWDPIEMREFDTVLEWASYMAEQEQAESCYQKIGGKNRFDDED